MDALGVGETNGGGVGDALGVGETTGGGVAVGVGEPPGSGVAVGVMSIPGAGSKGVALLSDSHAATAIGSVSTINQRP